MVIKNVNLETVCGITSKFPENIHYEVAFAGKSNVGKSSLINGILNRNSLARTSAQPGKTQTINFYNVNDALYLVDLPGYGYATANEEIKAQWGVMIENYLHTSKMLKAVFLLIDIRHDPSDNDCLMYDWMVNQGFAPVIIATKADKLKPSQIPGAVRTIEKVLQVEKDTIVIPFSAETKMGKEEIWKLIESLVFPEGVPDSCLSQAQKKAEEEKVQQIEKTRQKPDSQEGNQTTPSVSDVPQKKERWKKTGRPVAKKTARKQAAKRQEKRK